MEQHSKITQRHPSTGAQPSEQTSENAKNVKQQGQVQGIDELLYKLVENNVAYAGEQFGENLRFNSEVLTNVLYDNIRKVLGDKFEADDFANWLADELLKNGYVLKSSTSETTEQEPQQTPEPKEEIVYTIDEKDYQELLDKIHAALVLLETNRDTIAKRLSDVDGQVKELGNSIDTQTELKARKDKQIQELVDRIKSNQENVETYIESHEQVKREFAEKVLGLDKKIDEFTQRQQERQAQEGKLAIKTKDILGRVQKNWRNLQDDTEKVKDKLGELAKKKESGDKGNGKATTATPAPKKEDKPKAGNFPPSSKPIPEKSEKPVGKPAPKGKGKLGKSILPGLGGKKKSGKDILGSKKPKKQ